MKTYTAKELAVIIEKHGKWLRGEDGGEQANLSRADLSRANLTGADLSRADLTGASLSWADLSRADLSRANLSWANLSEADLTGANLTGANLTGAKGFVYISQRSDGHQFFATYRDDRWLIQAGCRLFTPQEYREHTAKYKCDKKRAETLLLIDFAEAMIAQRGIV
jgi:hypothetical protein